MMPTTFVLVHGGFGSPAELAPVVPYLEAQGHRAINVDLPCERPGATLEDYAATVVGAMRGTSRPRILVAHSAGGATVPLAASLMPVDRMVFVAAVVPEPGRSIAETLGPEVGAMIEGVTIDNGDGTRSFNLDLLASLAPPEERDTYLAFLRGTQRSQGWAAIEQPWPGDAIPDVPRDYILCSEDQVIPPDMQRAFAARLGVSPVEIASVHAVFTFRPRELAELLVSMAR